MEGMNWEAVSLIVAIIGGFGSLSYQVGKWRLVIEHVEKRMNIHEESCSDRDKDTRHRQETNAQDIAVLQNGLNDLKEDVKEIKILIQAHIDRNLNEKT